MRVQPVAFGAACAVWIVALPFALVMAVTSPRLAEIRTGPAVGLLVANFASFPLACLLGPIAAWIAWSKGQKRLAWGLAAAPLLWIATPVLLWALKAA